MTDTSNHSLGGYGNFDWQPAHVLQISSDQEKTNLDIKLIHKKLIVTVDVMDSMKEKILVTTDMIKKQAWYSSKAPETTTLGAAPATPGGEAPPALSGRANRAAPATPGGESPPVLRWHQALARLRQGGFTSGNHMHGNATRPSEAREWS